MKKLIVSLLLSVVAVNAFGMEAAKIAKYQYKFETQKLAYETKLALQKLSDATKLANTKSFDETVKSMVYAASGAAATAAICWAGYEMWHRYLNHLERNAQNTQSNNASQKSSWVPYAKIAAGLGLTGLTTYLGMKQSQQPHAMEINYSASGGASVGNTLSPQIMLSLSSAYTLAPMVPAYFFLKSGFKDLKTK